MNPGLLALGLVAAAIGAAIWVVWHREAIYGAAARPAASGQRPARPARPARRPAPPAHRPARQLASETAQKREAMISADVSGFTMPENDAEMIALRTIAKLVKADLVKETVALSTVFAVKPGSSKRYREVQEKLKIAQAEIGEST